MSTKKSLKQLRSKDKLLIANVATYFEKNPGHTKQSYIQQTINAVGVTKRKKKKRKKKRKTKKRALIMSCFCGEISASKSKKETERNI